MNPFLTRCKYSAALLPLFAGHCLALTLGPLSGTAVVGRPLDMKAAITGEDAQTACLSADVLYGEARIAAPQIRLTMLDGQARLLVTSPVNEPVVSVVIRAGCDQVSERRYTVLADAPASGPSSSIFSASASPSPSASVAPSSIRGTQPLPVRAELVEVPQASSADRPVSTPVETAQARADATPSFNLPSRLRRVASQNREPAPDRKTGAPRLAEASPRLRSVASLSAAEPVPILRVSTAMVIPDNGAPGRAAAAALWQAISAQPQEITRNTEQLTQLQAQVDDLRHQSLTLRGALAKTTPPPTPWLPPWLPTWALKAALAAFALLLLGAALALARWWLRHSRLKALRNDWAQSSIVGGLEPFERALAAADMARAEDAEAAREEAQLAEAASTQVPAPRHQRAAPGRVSRLVLPVLPPAMPPEETREETLATHRYESEVDSHLDLAPGTERVAALAVAQLEAEFFCTLGEPGEAASILSHYISEHPQASPLAYLELMELCRARDDREGYDQWRDAMQLAFKGEPPAFEHISRAVLDDSEDCELVAWPWLMERICAHWPSPRSQEEIEELLFDCAPGGPQMLSVQALRELLWLYEVGLTLAENQDGEGAMDEAHPAAARAAAAAAEVPFAGLDFDLGDFSLSQPDRPAPANDSHPTSLHAVAGNDSSRRAAAHV